MFCRKCGNPLIENAKFCSKCGCPVEAVKQNNEQIVMQQTQPQEQQPVQQVVQQQPVQQVVYQQNTQTNVVTNTANNTAQNTNNNQDNNKSKMILIGLTAGVVVLVIIFVAVFSIAINQNSNKYYFNPSARTADEDSEQTIVVEEKESETQTSKKGKYSTTVTTDNKYKGMEISDKSDAIGLIVEDSENQKDNYPDGILAVENELINNLDITAVNLKEMEPEFASELQTVFNKIYTDFPGVKGYLTNLSLINYNLNEGNGGIIAAFMPIFNFATSNTESTYPWVIKTQVFLNARYFLNKDRLKSSVEECSANGHFPKNTTIYSPVAHELGHYISFIAMMKHYNVDSILLVDANSIKALYSLQSDFSKGDFSLSMLTEAYENYINDTSDTIEFDTWRGSISGYALAKDNNGDYIYDETIAESFHDVYLNGDNAATASKYIYAVLKKYVNV